jgi:hypothetical protein
MRAFSLPVALLALALAAPARAFWFGPKAELSAVSAAPVIDGKADDWSLAPDDESEGLAYGVSRDDRYLYLVFVPHTRQAKEQLAGLYQQDLMIWLDLAGGKSRLSGLRILAPAELGEPARALEPVRVSTAAAGDAEASAAVGPMEGRGALEARLPLAWLGAPIPKTFSLGLEALAPRRPPAAPPAPSARDAREAPPVPKFESVGLWIRVSLPKRRTP